MSAAAGGSHGWRVPPPTPEQRIAWPAEFGQRFSIFVDTEEEFDWGAPFSRDARSVSTIAALPAMHRRFAERGIVPCYLCDYPVVADEGAAETLRGLVADERGTIGAQLHPWVNPPHVETLTPAASFVGNLPIDLQAAKLDRLTQAVTDALGAAPLAFRAGRYGIGPRTFELLQARGYRVDTSIRALHDYTRDGGPNFRLVGSEAFRAKPVGGLIALPLTSVYTGRWRAQGARWHRIGRAVPRGRGMLARAGLVSRVPLTPEGVSIEEACEAVRIAVGEGARLLTLSFHTPSLVPGHTPYVRDAADRGRFDRWWDRMLALFDGLGVRSASLRDVIAAADTPDATRRR